MPPEPEFPTEVAREMSVILAERQRPEPDVVVIRASTATRAYVSSGIHRDRLKVAVPYEIAIDL